MIFIEQPCNASGAGRWGPAVCFQNAHDGVTNADGQLLIADTVLEHNIASSGCAVNCSVTDLTYGGAIYAGSAVNSSLTLRGVTMINNTAHFGGALSVEGHYNVSITYCDFQDNIGDYHLTSVAPVTRFAQSDHSFR